MDVWGRGSRAQAPVNSPLSTGDRPVQSDQVPPLPHIPLGPEPSRNEETLHTGDGAGAQGEVAGWEPREACCQHCTQGRSQGTEREAGQDWGLPGALTLASQLR